MPGLGRAALAAADDDAEGLPVLQACMALLIGFGFTAGLAARLIARAHTADADAIPTAPTVSDSR